MRFSRLSQQLLPFVLAFVLPLLAIYAWWGGFNAVAIAPAERGPYTYAYLEQAGDYAKLPDLEVKTEQALRAQHIDFGAPITVLLSNPDLVNVNKRVGHAGFQVAPGTVVQAPLQVAVIPRRPVLEVSVVAGRGLAPSRAYAALDRDMQARGAGIQMPTVEHYAPAGTAYHMGLFRVEMPWPAAAP